MTVLVLPRHPVAAVGGAGHRRRGANRGRDEGKGISAYVDGSPSKGRVRKALRPQGTSTMAGNPLFGQRRDDIYESIVEKASKLFVVIRQSVVCDLAPSALKASFLDPLHTTLFSEVCLPLPFPHSTGCIESLHKAGSQCDVSGACRCSCRFSPAATSTL